MSDMKHDALVSQGIEIVERVPIPDELVPPDAHVEIEAKKAAGYYTPEPQKPDDLQNTSAGRSKSIESCRRTSETAARCRCSAPPPCASARKMLALGRRRLPNFRVDLGRLDATAELVIETTRDGLSDARRCRSIRAGGISTSTASTTGTRSTRRWRGRSAANGARRVRSRHRQRAARCRRRADWRYPRSGQRRVDQPLRRAGAGEPCDVPRRRVLDVAEPSAAGRCRRSWRTSPTPKLDRGFQVSDGQSAGRRRRAAPICCGGSARRWPRRRKCSACNDTPRPGGLFDHLAALARGRQHRRAGDPLGAAARISGRSGRRG